MAASPGDPATSALLSDPQADSETHSANRRRPSRERIIRVFTLSCFARSVAPPSGPVFRSAPVAVSWAGSDAAIGLPAQDPRKSMSSRALVVAFAACALLGCG